MSYSANILRLPSAFWVLMTASLVFMVLGHLTLRGQTYDPAEEQAFNPLRLCVSDYTGKWPEGLWIVSAISCFCLALAWFCDLAKRELFSQNWVISDRVFVSPGKGQTPQGF